MGIFELVFQVIHITSGPRGAGPAGAVVGGGFMAFFFGMWCFMLVLGLSGFVLFIIALVQILSRQHMPTEAKLLWCLVSWLVPVIGPILWWCIGAKQHPAMPTSPSPPPLARPTSMNSNPQSPPTGGL